MNSRAPLQCVDQCVDEPFRLLSKSSVGGAMTGAGGADELKELALSISVNVRRLRKQKALSLDGLAKRSHVSRAMLSQIELGRSIPTITVLWKIATALEAPFSALLSGDRHEEVCVVPSSEGKVLASPDGGFCSRALFPFDQPRRVEFYELRLRARGVEHAKPHPPGTVENLVVSHGLVEIEVAGAVRSLRPGDAILFEADVAHSYRNPGDAETVMYLVMTYAQTIG